MDVHGQLRDQGALTPGKNLGIARAERDGTRAETRFRLSPKRTSPFKSVGALVQSTAGSRGVRVSFRNAAYTMFGGGVRVLATHSIRQFPLHFPSRASLCATRFQTSSTHRTGGCVGSGAGLDKSPDFLDFRHYKGGSSSAIRTGRLYLRRNTWYSFSETESTPGNMVPSEGATEKNTQ